MDVADNRSKYIVEAVPWLVENPGFQLATPGNRISAFLIDFAVHSCFFWGGRELMVYLALNSSLFDASSRVIAIVQFMAVWWIGGLVGVFPFMLVVAFMMSRTGQTPGKWVFRIRVVRMSVPQERLGLIRAYIRQLVGWSIGWWWYQKLQSDTRRSLQDQLTDTIVVKA